MADYAPLIQDNVQQNISAAMWLNKGDYAGGVFNVCLRGTTTGNTATELYIDAITGRRVPVPNASAIGVIAYYVGNNITDSEATFYSNAFLIGNYAGTVALIGSVSSLLNTAAADVTSINDGSSTTTIAYTADNTNKAIAATVTGTAAKTIYHVAHLICIPVTNPENFISVTGGSY